MNKADCVAATDVPDFVATLWWAFVSIALIAGILIIVGAFLNALLEHFQDRKEAYLRAKKLKLEMKEKYGVEE